MKILHTVQLYSPAVGGSEEVVKQLSERLVKKGHDVTVATSFNSRRKQKIINGVNVEEFNISGSSVEGIKATKDEIKRFQDFILNGNFDVVMNYAAQIWSSDLVFPLLDKIKAKKIFVPCGYSALYNRRYKNYFEGLLISLRKYDFCVYLSETYKDKKFADENGLNNSVVIPNAANEDEFLHKENFNFKERYGIKNDFLLCVANHYESKGHAFVIKAYDLCKSKNLDLVIIGNHARYGCFYKCKLKSTFSKLFKSKKIHILSEVLRDHVVSAYKQAKFFVFGSKIECSPLVLFESLAAKLPFISTSCGNSAEIAEISNNMIVKTPEEMANKIDYLLTNTKEYNLISKQGFKSWNNNFTWNKIVDKYEKLYN